MLASNQVAGIYTVLLRRPNSLGGATLYTVLCMIIMRTVVECRELVEGRELLADLILLDVLGFDIILGIDWLA